MLDLESVRLFVLVAEHLNLTRAAEAAGTVQPVVSQRLKTLEATLGRRLLDRTPRFVRLTDAGTAFLMHARQLLAAHDAALASEDGPGMHVMLGVSDHVLGTAFATVLRRLRAALPAHAIFSMRLGVSQQIRALYDAGDIDLALVRREGGGQDGEVLGEDPLAWRAPATWSPSPGPLPLALLPPPCGVREVALKTLERAGLPWREAFVGGSCLALRAAVDAGIGVAPLGRLAGGDLPDRGTALGLPPLPSSRIVLLARPAAPHLAAAARSVAASVRDGLRA
ncbi:LysR family transcriptional regulator [Xanthomonas massiliensis]|uniref:LysR family transcriptional regulator n=1 Tax=Xanthomonas massiliensis TaxID=1720302 RepID=UPI0008269285|nr:LysR family transcriptional regulator [Xanthomonas massiliensis]